MDAIHSQLNWAIFIMWRHSWWKNWVICAVLTGNVAHLRTVFSSRFFYTENCAVHSGNPTVSSVYRRHYDSIISRHSTSTSVSSNSFSRWASHDIFFHKYHFLLNILCFLFFFLDNIMADVASKQHTRVLFLSTTVTRTRRHIELTKKIDKPDGKTE